MLAGLLCAGIMGFAVPQPVEAGVIERACRQSDRSAANPTLCGCIQRVANKKLTRSERKTVSKWFSDPHQAQIIRQSANRKDEQLWERYKSFGDTAAKVCG